MNRGEDQAMSIADFCKLVAIWVGTVVGSISLQQVVLGLTAIYTLLQIFVLVRDKLIRGKANG